MELTNVTKRKDPAIHPPKELLLDGSLEFLKDLSDFTANYEGALVEAKS